LHILISFDYYFPNRRRPRLFFGNFVIRIFRLSALSDSLLRTACHAAGKAQWRFPECGFR